MPLDSLAFVHRADHRATVPSAFAPPPGPRRLAVLLAERSRALADVLLVLTHSKVEVVSVRTGAGDCDDARYCCVSIMLDVDREADVRRVVRNLRRSASVIRVLVADLNEADRAPS